MGDVSENSLLGFMFAAGGKVKNSDLLKNYKHLINHDDRQLRAKYREEFKLIIDRIAVVKSENGEKYLVLKKKYRQQMQDQDAGLSLSVEGFRPSPTTSSKLKVVVQKEGEEQLSQPGEHGHALWPRGKALHGGDGTAASKGVSQCGRPVITIIEAPEPEPREEVRALEPTHEAMRIGTSTWSGSDQCLAPRSEEFRTVAHREDKLDRDSGSKSESELEQEQEDGTGSVESSSVALDPLEKAWMHSAACGRLADLSELLQQDPSLASKKDFTSTALHWAAKHGMGDMAALMASSGADVNTKAGYTPLHIAALHGHLHIMDLLVRTYGAKENLRDYSGHLASHYLRIRDPVGEDGEPGHQVSQCGERRPRRLVTLFQTKKKWGSAEDLPSVPEERPAPHQLALPPFRPRKFSR